jgi:hypothetical protein
MSHEMTELTADDVRDLIERHSSWVIGNNRCFHNGAYEAIADELNATLGRGTCKLVYGENDHGDDGWWCQSCGGWFAASFRHTGRDNIINPNYCQNCGWGVKR